MHSRRISKNCSLHRSRVKSVICKECKTFVCEACFVKDHAGHKGDLVDPQTIMQSGHELLSQKISELTAASLFAITVLLSDHFLDFKTYSYS